MAETPSEREPGKVPQEALDLTEGDLVSPEPASQTKGAGLSRWGDASHFVVMPSSAFAPAAVGFSLFGLIAAAFSFWWPALVIAPLAFGPGLSFAYLAAIDIRKNQTRGWKATVTGWAMGYAAVIIWHLCLFATLQPMLNVAWHYTGADLHVIWLGALIVLGLAHSLFLASTPAAAKLGVIAVMVLTLGTLVATGLLESRRDAQANVHKRRAGNLAIGIHQWLDTNPNSQPTRAGQYWRRRNEVRPNTAPGEPVVTEGDDTIPSMVWWVVVPIVGLIAGAGFLSWLSQQGPRDLFMDASMENCGKHPNCVSSKAKEAAQRVEPIPFTCSLDEARQRLQLAISSQPGARVEYREADYIYVTFRTRILRFVDDAEFRIDPQAQMIHCRSASRVGRSDFGVNRRRIESIRADFAADYMTLERST